jgi:Na+/melibiose symporter-like transporter
MVITEIWFYTFFSKYWMEHKTEFFQQLVTDIIGISIIVWLLNCMCSGKCKNTVWIIFAVVFVMSVLSIFIAHKLKMKDPYQEPV